MHRFVSRLLLVLFLLAAGHAAVASDWTQFRGPEQTGTAAPGSAAEWPDHPALDVVWKVDLGSGYSSLAVADGVVYTGFADGETDWLGAFDAATGERLWTLELGPRYAGHDGSHDGPIATPAVATIGDRTLIFAMGGHGRLVAASSDGEQVWSVALSEMGKAPFYGFSASPVVVQRDGKSVLVHEVASGEGPTVVGFDPLTGEVLWQQGDDEVHYQSPVSATLGGVEQVVAAGLENLYGLDPFTGEVLWTHEYGEEPRAMGPASTVPLHTGEGRLLVKPGARSSTTVTVSRGEEGWSVEPLWTSQDLSLSYAPAVRHDGHVFGYKRGFLVAVNAETGETVWRSRPPGDGFLAMADGHLVVATKKGSLHLAHAAAEGWQELASLDLFDDSDKNNDVWSDPVVAGGDVYVRSMSELARVAVRPATEDAATQTADAGRGEDPPAGAFARFLTSLELYADSPADKAAAVDKFMEEQKKGDGFPIVEGEHAIFVYRGDVDSVGIEGDMLGDRTQGEMRRAPGTNLFYFVSRLPSDAWVSYRLAPGTDEAGTDPLNERQIQVMGQRGPQPSSFVTMPDWRAADHMAGDPVEAGTMVHHDVTWPAPPAAEGADDGAGGDADEAAAEGEAEEEAEPITSRGIDVFLPEGFDADSGTTYPVVFVLGANMVQEPLALDRALPHYLGRALPNAVVVLVSSHDPNPMADVFGGTAAAAESFHEHVVPFVLETYPVAAQGPDHAYVGFTMMATHALEMGVDERSRAGRVALIQPFFLDSNREAIVEAGRAKTEHRPAIYFEVSPLTLRAEHEGWNAEDQTRRLAASLEDAGYEITIGSSNLPFVLDGLRPRVGPALAFALTGKPEVPRPSLP